MQRLAFNSAGGGSITSTMGRRSIWVALLVISLLFSLRPQRVSSTLPLQSLNQVLIFADEFNFRLLLFKFCEMDLH